MLTRQQSLFSACLIAAMFASSITEAAVIFSILRTPTTTAGGGATSTRSGAGTWHLYALDNDPASFGISSYNVTLAGATAINHRSPVTRVNDENGDAQSAGFNLLRTATNANPIQAAQNLPGQTPFLMTGFGKSASNFAVKLAAIDFAAAVVGPTTSASWGNYPVLAGLGPTYDSGSWLFLAEGTGNPTISSSVATVYSNQSFVSIAAQTQNRDFCLCSPPLVHDQVIDNVNANSPGSVAHTFTASNYNPETVTWGNFSFLSGPTPVAPATFDPATAQFNWSTVGSQIGSYTWGVQASTPNYGSDYGYITVNITAVPEPTSLILAGLSTLLGSAFRGRRSHTSLVS